MNNVEWSSEETVLAIAKISDEGVRAYIREYSEEIKSRIKIAADRGHHDVTVNLIYRDTFYGFILDVQNYIIDTILNEFRGYGFDVTPKRKLASVDLVGGVDISWSKHSLFLEEGE